jgi:hypothetical protein
MIYKFLDVLLKDVEIISDPRFAKESDWLGLYIGNVCVVGYKYKGYIPDTWYSDLLFFEPYINMLDTNYNTLYEVLRDYLNDKFGFDVLYVK